ncbi:hypothetical protein GN958_ATG10941 [Phytophthora infestans]|uniref:RxLR effector protein n=1 Tax=Phytophthora infestans TaxID=4787 RepID=A0A8S9UNB7_PHYIN|nr:hypothetical protein GN958_ATG19317 [Phytophthora infestans]KAF4139868.1 hypothetical protein GN958_ATG10941 [Phytophthora infestans]
MRPALYLLLAIFVLLSASTDAFSSTTSSDKRPLSQLSRGSKQLHVTRVHAADIMERSKKTAVVEGEDERGIFVHFEMFIAQIKAKIHGLLVRRFEHLDSRNITPDKLAKDYQIGTMAALARSKRFIKLYADWYRKRHPSWVTALTK